VRIESALPAGIGDRAERAVETPRRIAQPEWLQAILDRSENPSSGPWKSLEMQLDDRDGSVTVRVQRLHERVAVSVSFTDPALQTQAENQLHQIVETLQAHYRTDVDLSFSHSHPEKPDERAASMRRVGIRVPERAIADEAPPAETRTYGPGRHLWIG
jgi:hypothetical protein